MRAYLSGLAQPMTPERSALYARVLGETSSWSDVAMVEAREIISQSEPDEPLTFSVSVLSLQGSARIDGHGYTTNPYEGCIAMAESLAHFLTLDLQ